ncbi:MAG TPA: hypothetical protein VNZ22_13990 [Bacillota bacterium]|nr:hypothetical protein [Bacillota bacterium]
MSIFRHLARKIHGPRCHLDSEEKQWVERRMVWLRTQFGSEPIRRDPLDPTSQLLPKKWDGSCAAGADLLQRLCKHMLVDPSRLELQYYSEAEPIEPIPGFYEAHKAGPAGLFIHPEKRDQLIIGLDAAGLGNPAALAATICHELAHVHLLADRRITQDTEDGEPLTDLLTVYFGAGILTANSVFQFSQWQDGQMQGWRASRQGYLSEALFGYSLACFSWYRGDLAAGWRRHLRENIAYYFDDSMHFLSTTRETTIPFDGA